MESTTISIMQISSQGRLRHSVSEKTTDLDVLSLRQPHQKVSKYIPYKAIPTRELDSSHCRSTYSVTIGIHVKWLYLFKSTQNLKNMVSAL